MDQQFNDEERAHIIALAEAIPWVDGEDQVTIWGDWLSIGTWGPARLVRLISGWRPATARARSS
jgi:hypothetical protein